ncbi:DUF6096 family protein [Clostridium culturomicium]|uniref:DUF6096 family protein n=1 Tax=Clostridium culturomicium TaxID=1499683 RepID=UPI0005AA54D3|nr:DUF6096 family protein [Clostridium culturomicium]
MMYTNLTIGTKELKLRLRARDCVELERKLGKSPLDVMMELSNGSMPKVGTLITILHSSLQAFEHGYTEEKTYDLYDEYVEAGGTLVELMPVILEVFKVSGFFKEEQKQGEEAKN